MSEGKKPRQSMTRRQFLGYTLGGVGGFLGAAMLIPMVRFAIDPALNPGGNTSLVKIGPVDQFTSEPVEVKFRITQIDGWYQSQPTLIAWIKVMENGDILALSNVCKHLGCAVAFGTDPNNPERYYCPCHGGLYEINGLNVPGTPPLLPLDQYTTEIKDGNLYLGPIIPNQVVKEA